MKKRPWTPAEDAALAAALADLGHPTALTMSDWRRIAARIGTGRTDNACLAHAMHLRLYTPAARAGTRRQDIDLGLAVLSAVSPPGHQWTLRDIAEVCGCTAEAVRQIERRALQKLRAALGPILHEMLEN